MSRLVRLACEPSRNRTGGQIPLERSNRRRAMVRALGRELRVWHQWRPSRARHDCTSARGYCQHAVEWLRRVQNSDGGFGESIATYYDASLKGKGVSTASQTAWGLIGLLAASDADDPAVSRAVIHLIERQQSDGSWAENEFTGTGFPCVFYLKYHLYRNYFPLYALARYRNAIQRTAQFCALRVRPQEFDRQLSNQEIG